MARRGRSEGSIYQQTDGRWVAAVSIGYRNGKRQRKRIYGATRGRVADELKRILSQQQDGLPIAVGRQTVGQYLTSWLRDSVKPSVRPSTYRSYHQLVELHLKPGLGRYPLAKLSPQHVQRFLNDQLREGRVPSKPKPGKVKGKDAAGATPRTAQKAPTLTPRTVQYLHAVLRRALNQATRWGFVPRNVATLVTPPRVTRHEIQPMTPVQARDFLTAIAGRRLYALIAVAIACGLRQGEALGLQWDDVDLDRKALRVHHALQTINKTRQLVELKTERSRRTIALPDQIVAVLRTHRIQQKERRLAAGATWQETEFVFTTRHGTPLDGCSTTRDFKRLLTGAGLPAFRFHDLRHSCASFLLAQGVSPRVVMEILGHSQISLTMNTYAHVLPALQQDAAARMDAILRG